MAAAGAHARFVIHQRLHQIFLALAGDAGHRLGAGVAIGVTCRTTPAGGRLRALGFERSGLSSGLDDFGGASEA